mmetsp:Transcript_16874/g.57062  ORF Transcript_16874/g.57062 Transcript_16874/m.57062 type:complete len:366 (-) Transcript_16874:408-1505(-)
MLDAMLKRCGQHAVREQFAGFGVDYRSEEPRRRDHVKVRHFAAPRAEERPRLRAAAGGEVPARRHDDDSVAARRVDVFVGDASMDAEKGSDVDDDGGARPVAAHEVEAARLGRLHHQHLRRAFVADYELGEVHGHAVLEEDVPRRRDGKVVGRHSASWHRVLHPLLLHPRRVVLDKLQSHLPKHRLLRPRKGDEPLRGWVDVRVRREAPREVQRAVHHTAVDRDAAHLAAPFKGARLALLRVPLAQRLQSARVQLVRHARLPQRQDLFAPGDDVCVGHVLQLDVSGVGQPAAAALRPKGVAKNNGLSLFFRQELARLHEPPLEPPRSRSLKVDGQHEAVAVEDVLVAPAAALKVRGPAADEFAAD